MTGVRVTAGTIFVLSSKCVKWLEIRMVPLVRFRPSVVLPGVDCCVIFRHKIQQFSLRATNHTVEEYWQFAEAGVH